MFNDTWLPTEEAYKQVYKEAKARLIDDAAVTAEFAQKKELFDLFSRSRFAYSDKIKEQQNKPADYDERVAAHLARLREREDTVYEQKIPAQIDDLLWEELPDNQRILNEEPTSLKDILNDIRKPDTKN